MRLRLASDIHTEFLDRYIDDMDKMALDILPRLDSDDQTVLILAGDIGSMHKPEVLVAFIDQVAPRFRQVLYIPGNHEYYGARMEVMWEDLDAMLCAHDNLIFMENGAHGIDGHNFHMSTLWTDFNGEDAATMLEAQSRMNDYRHIWCGNRVAKPGDMLERHRSTMRDWNDEVREGDIIVSHHLPSFQSVPPEYKNQKRINGAYASDLEEFILSKKPALWVHGHTHNSFDYMIGDTRVVCNPRGYEGGLNKEYNPVLVIDI